MVDRKLIWGRDLYKGFKLDKNQLLTGGIDDILPFQMLSMEEKTLDWIKAVADYYETAGWRNVERKASRIQRNYWMRYGKLNQLDYIINPTQNDYYAAINMIVPPESNSPLEQFYPLIPNFVDILRGEFIKRDNTWTVDTKDPYSHNEAFTSKKQGFQNILTQQLTLEKQKSLAELGITPQTQPQDYNQQMQGFQNQLNSVELESRNFRTAGAKWAQKVLDIQNDRYTLHETEPDGFECGLVTDSEFWHLDLLEDDFRLELVNTKYADYHKAPNKKYVSDGDYFLWFDFLSAGNIVTQFGRIMKEEDILKLRDIYVKTANIIVPDEMKVRGDSYYDHRKGWAEATQMNPAMNDALLGKELAYNFMRSPNFDHNQEVDILNPVWGRLVTGHPQMFRVMRLYWRSFRKIGWLNKVGRDGQRQQPEWIDENYKITVDPIYDTSVVKEKSHSNLIYGEHVDWTWTMEWRHVIKISPNQKHTFWLNSSNTLESIYLDGGPVRFQFKGVNDPFNSLPPVEGCQFNYINTGPHGFVDRLKSMQVIYNICMNKVPKMFLKDKGPKVFMDRRMMPTNHLANTTNMIDPLEAAEDKLNNSDIFDYTLTRESLEGMGQPALPTVENLSTVEAAQYYFRLGQEIKMEAGEIVGITRQRQSKQMASDTAYSVEQGINFSETQTEKYFEQHANLMQRVRQRMVDAAQYYSTFQENLREVYMNDMDENIFLDVTGMENTLPQYSVNLKSRANVRAALKKISDFLQNDNTLPIKSSAKIEGIIEASLPELLYLIKKGELDLEQREIQKEQADRAQMEAQRMHEQEMQDKQIANDDKNKDLDRQTEVIVAQIKKPDSPVDTSGIQTNNALLNTYMKQQDLENKKEQEKNKVNADRQKSIDQMTIDREKMQNAIEKERVKGQEDRKTERAIDKRIGNTKK